MKIILRLLSIVAILSFLIIVSCPNDNNGGQVLKKIMTLQAIVDNASNGSTVDLNEYLVVDGNAQINKSLTLKDSEGRTDLRDGQITVNSDGISLNNISNGSVTASSNLGNGSLKITNSELNNVNINGGGIGTIKILDTTVKNLKVDKTVDDINKQFVRLQVSKGTKIFEKTEIKSGTLIDITGKKGKAISELFTTLDISGDVDFAVRSLLTMDAPDGKWKVDFDTGNENEDFYCFVRKGGYLNESFVTQVAYQLVGSVDKLYEKYTNTLIDFNQPITDNSTYTVTPKTPEFIALQMDGSNNYNAYLQTGDNLDFSNIDFTIYSSEDPSIICLAQDKYGTSFLFYKDKIGAIGSNIKNQSVSPQFTNAITTSGSIPWFNFNESFEGKDGYVNSAYTRADIYDKDSQEMMLFTVTNCYPNSTSEGEDLPTLSVTKMTPQKNVNDKVVGITYDYKVKDDGYINIPNSGKGNKVFVQGVATDKNMNVYIAVAEYTKKIPNPLTTVGGTYGNEFSPPVELLLDKDNSYIYKCSLEKDPTPTPTNYHYTNELNVMGEISYEALGILMQDEYDIKYVGDSSSTVFSLKNVLANYSFGVVDMRIVGDTLVICTEDKFVYSKGAKGSKSKGKVIFYDLVAENVIGTFEEYGGEKFYGPCRIAYADKNNIIIYENGYNWEDKKSPTPKVVGRFVKFTFGKDGWGSPAVMKYGNAQDFPLLYEWIGD